MLAMALPNEIIFDEILPCLPAKSLVQFKCVSKHWCNTFAHPGFISTHLRKSRPPGNIILAKDGKDYAFSDQETSEFFDLQLGKLVHDDNSLIPLVSFHGLLVIQSNPFNMSSGPCYYVCNPITRQFVKLPNPPFVLNPCGIAYDSTSRKYKVVAWSRSKGCAIYTLGDGEKGSWRLVDLPKCSGDMYTRAISSNGYLYWVSGSTDDSEKACILCMDIAREKIAVIKMPRHENDHGLTLMEMKGSMYTVFPAKKSKEMSIWILDDWKKYHWTKMCKCISSRCGYYAISKMVPYDRSKLRNGLLPLREIKPGFPYRIDHVNSLVSWDDNPFGHPKSEKIFHQRTISLDFISKKLKAWIDCRSEVYGWLFEA